MVRTALETVANVLWLLLAGIWLAIGYVIAGILAFIFIITIPFGVASFRLAMYSLWPFGQTVVRSPDAGALTFIANVLWFVIAGWWLALAHIVVGVLLMCTIIGIPFGIACIKLAVLAIAPLGSHVVPAEPGRIVVTPR